jgi:ribosomal protein S18 acetylase RimI-like enzyme
MVVDVEPVAPSEEDHAVAALVMAFSSDPFLRWMYPEPTSYLTHFPAVIHAFGGEAFRTGFVRQVDSFTGAALWMAPGVDPGGAELLALFDATIEPTRLPDLRGVLDLMDEHHPTAEHWYLPWFGVDTWEQGRGLGSVLMSACLAVVDQDHLPAYLDSTNPRNVGFYRRHGFEVTGQWSAGESPPIISMLRPAQ